MRFHLTLPSFVSMRMVIGLLASIACIAGFAAIAEDVIEQEALVRFDRALDDELHATTTPESAKIFEYISLFGSQMVAIVTLVVALYYLFKRRWMHLGIWVLAIAGGELLNLLLKTVFNRPRPSYANAFVQEINTSFPSGHAMVSVILYGMLAYFLVIMVRSWKVRILLIFGAILIIELIGISRLYLGVHYLSDVVAGFFAGGIWLATCITTMEVIRERKSKTELNEHT